MAWLFLWMVVGSMASMMVFGVIMAIARLSLFEIVIFTVWAVIMALFLAAALYVANLPFMLLAFKSPFYRARFESTFALPGRVGQSPFVVPDLVDPATTSGDAHDPARPPDR